jgi:hypothetical protein
MPSTKKEAKVELKSLLQLFITVGGNFIEEHATGLTIEIKRNWYQLATVVSANRLLLIHDAISNHGLKVDFKYAYTVLVYGCTKLTQGETNVE